MRTWNWQQDDWANFKFKPEVIEKYEKDFLIHAGIAIGAVRHISDSDRDNLTIELISDEAVKTSEIEGEYLNRDSIQISLKRNFGLEADNRRITAAESGISEMMVDLYNNYQENLTHETLFNWHKMLTNGRRDIHDIGRYRTHDDPMQVISGSMHNPKVHFEAPPSKIVKKEMDAFIKWFNKTSPHGKKPLPALQRAAISHLYFLCIHPFEDGNGRIGRAIATKALAQAANYPLLIALSTSITKNKKDYYKMLEENNQSLEISSWLEYFAKLIIAAQEDSAKKINFIIEKAKLYDRVKNLLNERQLKALTRVLNEGIDGFTGGLSAENYISITDASRATATRDLHDMVEKGAFIKTGEKKHTRYFVNFV